MQFFYGQALKFAETAPINRHTGASPEQNEDKIVKIDDPLKKPSGLGTVAPQVKPGRTADKSGVEKTRSDNVTLSSAGQALAGQSSTSGAFDARKVEEIKAAIASGQFQVNAERIADGLIDSVKDLISSRHR